MNVGLVLPHLGASQLSFIAINHANFISGISDDEFYLFTKNPSEPCVSPGCAVMNISEVIGFKGLLIATDLGSADLIRSVPTDAILVFYVWDLQFLRNKKDFINNVAIYRDKRLTLIARSESHAKVISNYCNRKPDMVIPNLNVLKIREEMTGEEYEFSKRLRAANPQTV